MKECLEGPPKDRRTEKKSQSKVTRTDPGIVLSKC